MKSPISQIKAGVKKLETQMRKLFFAPFTESIDKTTTEIEMCDTLPDIPDVNETELDVELCDTVDTLPAFPGKIPYRQMDKKQNHPNQRYRKLNLTRGIQCYFSR